MAAAGDRSRRVGPPAAAALALPVSVVLRGTHPLWSLCLAAPVALWNAVAISDDVPMWRGLLALAAFVLVYLAARRVRGRCARDRWWSGSETADDPARAGR